MELRHHPRAGAAGRGERARAEERLEVVRVHHVGLQLAHGGVHPRRVLPASQQRGRCAGAARVDRAPLEQAVLHPGAGEGRLLELDRPLLAPLDPVAVVEDQDARLAVHRPRQRYFTRQPLNG